MTTSQNPLFLPAINKAGLSRLTFLKTKDITLSEENVSLSSEDIALVTDELTEKMGLISKEITIIIFAVMGQLEGSQRAVLMPVSSQYTSYNDLGKILKAMGFVEPEREYFTNEEGFIQYKDNNLGSLIESFFKSKENAVYVGRMYNKNNDQQEECWRIDVETLKAF
ncbi:hypothetical protein [Nodularia sp. NIES-3585]|uniref:hypothetical protein n=1 Tax=Nodularia sp. NIES-3585 TaxID=1973477 RepID=UPI000B5C5E68|nr:hypothetical protein [Nodularia sp. NIES-3585]GAX36817.1 hypothetical protein NIES3585_28540 [Nodularia sp. NIES-3585]